MVSESQRLLLSGNEAIALAARHYGVALGTGYPGTPSTEILEAFSELGGHAQWAPNEKVALEVAIGVAFAEAPAMAAMKHVGLNVAADALFTVAYTGTTGPLLIVSADDPGMASSQNEQDNRRFAVAAGVPMLEPSDSQEAYDFVLRGLDISAQFGLPVLLRVTTRVCHSKSVVATSGTPNEPAAGNFHRDIPGRVMIPSNARPAHRRLRKKLAELAQFNEMSDLNPISDGAAEGDRSMFSADGLPEKTSSSRKMDQSPTGDERPPLGIITSGISVMHVREAAPRARVMKLGMSYPLPLEKLRRFAESVERCLVIEEGDPYLVEQLSAAGIRVEGKAEMFRFGELDVDRARRILAGDTTPDPVPPPGRPPALCAGCPHRPVYETLKKLDCLVPGDIGCYSLGALPPFESMDTLVCMGASIGMGLGMRHVLPEDQARRVVSVIGDSTFVHGGITGLVEMAYNRPPTGHVVLILDNTTTAMTGLQEHPGTGKTLDHQPTHQLDLEQLARAVGIDNVYTIDPVKETERLEHTLRQCLDSSELSVIITRRPCLLAAAKLKRLQQASPLPLGEGPGVRAENT